MKRGFSPFSALLAVVLVLTAALAADAAPGARLRFGVAAGGSGPGPGPGELGEQTVYFGPSTLVGNGGAEICAAPCVQPWSITSGAPANYMRDADDGLLIPKDGGVAFSYNALRTTGALTSATFTITDAIGQTKLIRATVDEGRAGKFTIRSKPTKDEVGGVIPQFIAALREAGYGDHIAWRDGSRFNTPGQAGTLNGTTAYGIRNDGPIAGVYNGDNPVVIRPETGGAATMGHIRLDGQGGQVPTEKRLNGLRFQYMNFYGVLNDVPLLQSTNLVSNIDIYDSTFRGDEGDWLNGDVPRPRGVTKDTSSGRWRVHRSTFEFLEMGVVLPNSDGPPNGGAETYSDPAGVFNEVKDSTFRHIFTDAVHLPCATGAVVTGNLFTDKVTGLEVGPTYPNPFDTAVQPHGDAIQFSNTSCGWGRLAGPTVVGNIITRGFGRDSLPMWTVANGYPNPNTPGPSCCLTPNPAFGYNDYQGIFSTGSEPGKANHLAYSVVWVGPTITHNLIQTTMNNGISVNDMENPVIEFNVAIADEPGPANLLTSPFGAVTIKGGPITGTSGRVRYNVATNGVTFTVGSGGAVDLGTGGGISGTTNVLAPRANYTTLFEAPLPTRRTPAEAAAAFRPKVGGPLFVNDNQPAGVWCPSGELRSAAAC